MSLLNADGSYSEVSGNGVRCLAAWLALRADMKVGVAIDVETDAGTKRLELLERTGPAFTFRAAMGSPEDVRMTRIDVDGTSDRRSDAARRQPAVRGPWSGDRRSPATRWLRRSPFIRISRPAPTSSSPRSKRRIGSGS